MKPKDPCGPTRVCRVCGVEKLLEDFPPHAQSACGRQRRCRSCTAEASRARYGPAALERAKQRNAYTLKGRANVLLQSAKGRAKVTEQPITIDSDWIAGRLEAGVCEVTGIPFVLTPGSPRAPSLDKRVPSDGYTPENTRLVLWFYNRAKGAASEEEALELIHEISANTGRAP